MIAEKLTEESIKKLTKELGDANEKTRLIKVSLRYSVSFIFLLITGIYALWFTWLRYKTASQNDGAIIHYIYGNISKSPEQWGQFGDFIGGVLNSTFSSITLLLSFAMMRESQKNHRQSMELQVLMAQMQKDEIAFNKRQSEKGQAGILSLYISKIKYGLDKAERFLEITKSDVITKDTICAYLDIFVESVQIAHEQRIYEIISRTTHDEVCELISFEVEFNSFLKKLNNHKETSYRREEISGILEVIDAYKKQTKELLGKLEFSPV